MKKLTFTTIYFFLFITLFAQSSNYFPNNLGYVWNYKVTPLDSLGNPNSELSAARIDSFASTGLIHGKESKIILSKNGPINTINTQPFLDSNFVNFNENVANVYFSVIDIDSLVLGDSLIGNIIPELQQLMVLIKSLTGWYPIYNFGASVNQSTTLFSKDTTITIDSIAVPLRFSVKTKRLSDELLQTYLGNFTCKKFEVSLAVSIVVQVLPPPFPPVVYDLIKFPQTSWIAQDLWVLKDYMPNVSTTTVPGFDIPSFTFPGYLSEISEPFTSVKYSHIQSISDFNLYQNYPNPFNPETNITFSINKTSKTKLVISNILGEEIKVLINEELAPGLYTSNFNAGTLSSGTYFYTLYTNNNSKTKKMQLIK
ncbi:MAG TPA: T9SS type A sorting domain-containing protein [Melioribacteraceae bacterium]|nr:T9SS type A sorting domain-containing protein [Melioribacteraceae bacterium]